MCYTVVHQLVYETHFWHKVYICDLWFHAVYIIWVPHTLSVLPEQVLLQKQTASHSQSTSATQYLFPDEV